jgi:hypothetical protein
MPLRDVDAASLPHLLAAAPLCYDPNSIPEMRRGMGDGESSSL